jgi:sirohydrochlorin cobaltochelatase
MAPALILFAHGARDPEWSQPFERVLAQVRAGAPGRAAVLAYLEFMSPDLGGAVRALVEQGHRSIRVVPLFLGPGGHLRQEIPRLVSIARDAHPGVSIELAAPAGQDDAVVGALAAYALR